MNPLMKTLSVLVLLFLYFSPPPLTILPDNFSLCVSIGYLSKVMFLLIYFL